MESPRGVATNVRPGRSFFVHRLRLFANACRSFYLLRVRYPWVEANGMTRIPASVTIWSPHKRVRFGSRVQFGKRCTIQCDAEFGNDVLVAGEVAFVGRDDHRIDVVGRAVWDSPRGDTHVVRVEDDVWIGYRALIVAGVTLGRGSVVAAGSVVVKDVPRYAVVAGVPARVVRWRFQGDQIVAHESAMGYVDRTDPAACAAERVGT